MPPRRRMAMRTSDAKHARDGGRARRPARGSENTPQRASHPSDGPARPLTCMCAARAASCDGPWGDRSTFVSRASNRAIRIQACAMVSVGCAHTQSAAARAMAVGSSVVSTARDKAPPPPPLRCPWRPAPASASCNGMCFEGGGGGGGARRARCCVATAKNNNPPPPPPPSRPPPPPPTVSPLNASCGRACGRARAHARAHPPPRQQAQVPSVAP
jgi:hypothetical protein